MTVLSFKEKVRAKTGIDTDAQRLIYGGKQLQDEKLLTDYELQNNSLLFLVLRLPGGASHSESERNPHPSLPRSENECAITLTEGESLEMPCGHALSPDGLTGHIKSELGKKRDEVRCPVKGCERVWPLGVLKTYSCATQVETWFMEMKLSDNACKKSSSIVNCPQCESLCTPNNPSRVDVECVACRAKGKTVIFCYKCLHMCTWEKHTSKYVCKYRDCISNGGKDVLKILKETPEKKVIGVSCPSIRACPSCGMLIEHIEYCKHTLQKRKG